jgi:alkylation response protein AidB-like acyl-CoA dehydrogenase
MFGACVMAADIAQDSLRAMLRGYLDEHAPATTALTDPDRTRAFAAAFEPASLLVPGEFGGAGGSAADAVVVAAESARALLGGEVLAQLLGTTALVAAPAGELRADLLTALASGTMTVTAPVWTAAGGPGTPELVLAGFPATHALSFDRSAGELRLRSAEVGPEVGPGAVEELGGMDPTRPLGRVGPAVLSAGRDLARGQAAEVVLARYLSFARVAIAAEQAACARRCVELTVEYAGQRTQFGVAIATFQAVKHTCATMHVDTTEAEALIARATAAADESGPGRARLAAQAKALASEAFTSVARSAIEVHGGVGFAFEHPVQLFYKRALVTSAYFGRPADLYASALASGQMPDPGHDQKLTNPL